MLGQKLGLEISNVGNVSDIGDIRCTRVPDILVSFSLKKRLVVLRLL